MYVHIITKKIWPVVSNALPFHKLEENPKNWKNNLITKNITSPKDNFFPR
jgi:hypothetical protein